MRRRRIAWLGANTRPFRSKTGAFPGAIISTCLDWQQAAAGHARQRTGLTRGRQSAGGETMLGWLSRLALVLVTVLAGALRGRSRAGRGIRRDAGDGTARHLPVVRRAVAVRAVGDAWRGVAVAVQAPQARRQVPEMRLARRRVRTHAAGSTGDVSAPNFVDARACRCRRPVGRGRRVSPNFASDAAGLRCCSAGPMKM